jgi:cation:H+ antiporter
MTEALMILVSGLFLWKGADWFVGGAARIAKGFGVSELVVGLTIVAMGTSAPELAVSATAALQGQGAIALGNVVGSNVFNLGIVLGICALLQTLKPSPEVWRRDGPLLVLAVASVWWFVRDGSLDRLEGGLLVLGMVAYLTYLFTKGSLPPGEDDGDEEGEEPPDAKTWLLMALGLVLILAGGRLLVDGASGLATAMGMSPWLISVTIVAAGTSAPELVTSVTAARKGMASMALGGLIGSDIFNTVLVLGVAGLVAPLTGLSAFRPALGIMGATIVGTILLVALRRRIGTAEGLLLLGVALARWGNDLF